MRPVPTAYDLCQCSLDQVLSWCNRKPEFNCDRTVREILMCPALSNAEKRDAITVYFRMLDRIVEL